MSHVAPTFIHLRAHSEYSMVDGLLRIKPTIEHCVSTAMPAMAITDQGNLCGLVHFYKAANVAGIKFIAGADVWVHDPNFADDPFRVVFLIQNSSGYRHLTELISESYLKGQQHGIPVIEMDWIKSRNQGLIVLSGAREGDVGRALLNDNHGLAVERLGVWNNLFEDRYYLELQRTGRADEEAYLHHVIGLAQGSHTPVVATNDVRFLHQEDFAAHEARVCINQGRVLSDPRRPRNYSPQQYFKSATEMTALFADIPEALHNSVEIARRCTLKLRLGEYFLPAFPVPDGMTEESYFEQVASDGLERRLDQLFDRDAAEFALQRQRYDERLRIELDVILQMGFPGYFLIVADFIQWSRDNAIPVGPGRGSGAGSLVAYALKITDLDPLAYDLLFERFLNPERVSMPDFDVDFCMEGRDRVIDYVAETYGRDAVSQIITFGTMAAKAVVRDAGRVLGKPYGMCDRLSKMIPFDLGITLKKAFEQEEPIREAYETDDDIHEIWDLARKLEGLIRGCGKHAGGVVIAPTKLTEFAPLLCDENGANLVAQFDKDDVESVGLVKFDFLGLRTLTIIDWALHTLNRNRVDTDEQPIAIEDISLSDAASFKLLQEGRTTAVFQLESGGMKKLIRQLKPSTFEDIIALVALYRPGPLGSGMDQDFVNRKHGREKVVYPHPMLEPILKPTYGTILYQEQVMQIAQVLANYSLGGADLLRRAMGKKKVEVMAQQRRIFTEGAKENDVPEDQANRIFDLMEEFAKYGFNKSHSAAYALISFQTAWLKAHFPAAFLAAVMSSDMDNTDKVVTYVDDAKEHQLKILPPDVNRGDYRFTIDGVDTIIYGIGAIKGVGHGAIESIVNEREAHGPYCDLFDFCLRIDLRKANRRVLEALIKAGALDTLGVHRADLLANLDDAVRAAEQASRDRVQGQEDLFGGPAMNFSDIEQPLKHVREWPENYRLQCEKDTLGLFLTGHPINRYRSELKQLTTCQLSDVQPTRRGEYVTVAGLIVSVRIIKIRNGRRIAIVSIDDRSARIDVAVYGELYEQYASLLVKDKILIVRGDVSPDDYSEGLKLSANELWDITSMRESRAQHLELKLLSHQLPADFGIRLKQQLAPFVGGTCPITMAITTDGAEAMVDLGPAWRVSPTDDLIYRLEDLVGQDNVRCRYP